MLWDQCLEFLLIPWCKWKLLRMYLLFIWVLILEKIRKFIGLCLLIFMLVFLFILRWFCFLLFFYLFLHSYRLNLSFSPFLYRILLVLFSFWLLLLQFSLKFGHAQQMYYLLHLLHFIFCFTFFINLFVNVNKFLQR